ncbi:MAG: hypothetical protein EHM79_00185 [Geobacter sp.]|nr:MAG: hypothetical protein EHM79_00185 [Geobacter sp.]
MNKDKPHFTDLKPRLTVELSTEQKSALNKLIPTGFIRPIFSAIVDSMIAEMKEDPRTIIYNILTMKLSGGDFIANPIDWIFFLYRMYEDICPDVSQQELASVHRFLLWVKNRGLSVRDFKEAKA